MNAVDEFFASSGWEVAVRKLAPRLSQLKEEECTTALSRLISQLHHSPAAMMVLNKYLEILEHMRGRRAEEAYFAINKSPPKFTREHLLALAEVKDHKTAVQFYAKHTSVWRDLLISQWIVGEPFWELLFASACVDGRASPSRAGDFAKTTLVIGENGARRRVFKILPLSDGGFAVTAPYHESKTGSLMKSPVVEDTGFFNISFEEIVKFHASDRVKLSYHWDGFVQFSGEQSSSILSGRDPETGAPRGLGLISASLEQPVRSGPSVTCSVWGLSDFQCWTERSREKAVIFEEDADFYTEPSAADDELVTRSSYTLSIFPLPAHVLEAAVGQHSTGDTLSMLLPMNVFHRDTLFKVKLLRVSDRCTLGVIAMSGSVGFEGSGFELSSPSDLRHCMVCLYPPVAGLAPGRSLDYRPT